MFSVATPYMRLFDPQSQRDKYINNIQKQCIYKIENSNLSWTNYTEKTASIFYSSGCIPIRSVLKIKVNKTKKRCEEIIFNAFESLRNNEKQPNEDSIYATINKDLTSVTMENWKNDELFN